MERAADSARHTGAQVTASPAQGISFINAEFSGGIGSLRVQGTRIMTLNASPEPEDVVVDLQGDRLLPGFINAHDHLQLNNLPSCVSPGGYLHARDWVHDVDSRRRTDEHFEAHVAVARDDRLVIGGLKNLLSGVTTVAHHDPLYPALTGAHFPISVVRNYGWSHSLYLDGEKRVAASYRSTPTEWPWIVHAAEGVNKEAGNEFQRLDALGCIQHNTLLVHGIALDHSQRKRMAHARAGLIWCPSSNLNLFGKTAEVSDLAACNRVAIGTDSRLSGARDLLAELRIAGQVGGLDDHRLEFLVTRGAARLLRLPDRGELQPGLRADLVVMPARARLSAACRADVRLVMVGGNVRYGDVDCAGRLKPESGWAHVVVDGRAKLLDGRAAEIVSRAGAIEAGLELSHVAGRAA
jgi:cytosine/adenosine deaminase-related metal-dependent hydrolase